MQLDSPLTRSSRSDDRLTQPHLALKVRPSPALKQFIPLPQTTLEPINQTNFRHKAKIRGPTLTPDDGGFSL